MLQYPSLDLKYTVAECERALASITAAYDKLDNVITSEFIDTAFLLFQLAGLGSQYLETAGRCITSTIPTTLQWKLECGYLKLVYDFTGRETFPSLSCPSHKSLLDAFDLAHSRAKSHALDRPACIATLDAMVFLDIRVQKLADALHEEQLSIRCYMQDTQSRFARVIFWGWQGLHEMNMAPKPEYFLRAEDMIWMWLESPEMEGQGDRWLPLMQEAQAVLEQARKLVRDNGGDWEWTSCED
ncbi:hypothetical protein BDZ91DRAFT_849240 [Kalaharituber pfeilii]|nr:hypothetical protein BDZ91DRAFT_849240 [Kalaharituber pfeilii]